MCPKVPTAPEILPTRISSGGGGEAREIALHFVVPESQFQAERDRLGVDAVRSPDLHRVLEFERARLQHRGQIVDAFENHFRSAAHQQGLRGVDDVVRRQPVMQPARRVRLARLRPCSLKRRW